MYDDDHFTVLLENNLPMFQLNAPVIIRAKVKEVLFIAIFVSQLSVTSPSFTCFLPSLHPILPSSLSLSCLSLPPYSLPSSPSFPSSLPSASLLPLLLLLTFPCNHPPLSPVDVYFTSSSYDQTARLWCTDLAFPLRIFAGHTGGVNVCGFFSQ